MSHPLVTTRGGGSECLAIDRAAHQGLVGVVGLSQGRGPGMPLFVAISKGGYCIKACSPNMARLPMNLKLISRTFQKRKKN